MATKREMKPRPAVAVSACTLSQLNCEPVAGVNSGRYLGAVRDHADILRPVRLGQLVLVRLAAWERLIERLAAEGRDLPDEPAREATANDTAPPAELASVDDVLARLGQRRKAGAR